MEPQNLSLVLKKLKTFFESPERVFIIIAAIFGISMIVTMPLFMVPDEAVHFDRAYQISEGHMTSQTINGITGGIVPTIPGFTYNSERVIPPIPRQEYFNKIPQSSIKFNAFPSSALYSPAGYIPQATGMAVSRAILPASIGSMALMGRLFNLITYIFLIYLAIRIARQGKWVYAAVGLFPVSIQEAASLSTDVMTIGLAFITIAFLHSLFIQKGHVNTKQYIYLGLLGIGLGLTKQTNIVLLLPTLFLPKSIFPSIWKKIYFIICGLGLSILVAAMWYLLIKHLHYEIDYSKTLKIGNINQYSQLKLIIEHPISFAKTLFRTYIYGGYQAILPDFYWVSMYGYFSWFNFQLPIPFISLGYISLLITLLYSGNIKQKLELTYRLTIVQTITFILSMISIAGALYLVWTPVGAQYVSGLQGRYFIPLLPLLIPLFTLISRWVKLTIDKPHIMGLLVSIVALVNLTAMLMLTYKYFP